MTRAALVGLLVAIFAASASATTLSGAQGVGLSANVPPPTDPTPVQILTFFAWPQELDGPGTVSLYWSALYANGGCTGVGWDPSAAPEPSATSASGFWYEFPVTETTVFEYHCSGSSDYGTTDSAAPLTVTVTGGGALEPYTNAALNVFDTLDPLAMSPSAISANGILFADGFEDGSWIDPTSVGNCDETLPGPDENDGWVPHSQMCNPALTTCAALGKFWCTTYATAGSPAFKFGHLRPGTVIDPAVGNFGAAGTPGAASTTWIAEPPTPRSTASGQGFGASHAFVIAGGDEWSVAATGPQHYYFRMYYALRGVTSTVCDCNAQGGWDCDDDGIPTAGACPAFVDTCGNGLKGIEEEENITTSGGLSQGFDLGHHWSCSNLEVADYSSQTFLDLPGAPFSYDYADALGIAKFPQNNPPGGGPPINTRTPDVTMFVEVEVDRGTDETDGAIRMWINNCGLDGMDCGPGTSNPTPTLRAEYTGLDLVDVRFGGEGFRAWWMNYWTTGVIGERVFDNMLGADGAVRGPNNPLGFTPNIAGVTVAP